MLKQLLTLVLAAALLTGCATATATNPIPTLDPQGDVYKTEGPNDPLIYQDPLGNKKTLIVYCDFPDRIAKHTTEEHAAKVLGGTAEDGTFQTVFKTNSYGKLKLDITQIHGWRTMPKDHKHEDYNPATTEGHRKMFVDAFALYPEINFLEYDYILVLMTAKGNFAFGERPATAIPYRDQKITVGVTQSSRNPYTLAHELAHCMGLPDLYTYGSRVPEGTPSNPLGPWDIMSGSSTGFIGWHRHKFEWLDNDRKTYLTEGTHTFTLTPLSSDEGVSMIVVPDTGEDATKPSKVYVVEVAQYLRPGKNMPRPRGVLVYSVDAKLPTGFNPVVVHPREDKLHAAFHEGEHFDADDAPLSLRVLKKNSGDSYEVEVVIR